MTSREKTLIKMIKYLYLSNYKNNSTIKSEGIAKEAHKDNCIALKFALRGTKLRINPGTQ